MTDDASRAGGMQRDGRSKRCEEGRTHSVVRAVMPARKEGMEPVMEL